MDRKSKRQLTPQAGTPGKKARGTYNPREEATAPTRNPPRKAKKAEDDDSDEARDKVYLDNVQANEISFDFAIALVEENIKEAMRLATTDEQRTRAQKASEYIEKVGRVIHHHTVTHMQLSNICLLYTSPSPRDGLLSRMPSSA